ncbi:MAG: ATP-binding protein [Bacteroidaceae bacterium]|nr:ATP-binding protein [Bacteroidaceae bacterium]
MKLYSLTLKNFRGYKDETTILFDNLTAIVGKNDIGKSSILEALDIFCNTKPVHPIEKSDLNVDAAVAGETDIEITAEFTEFPATLVIDATNQTSLADEYLLTADGRLKVRKVYPNAGKEKVYIIANHPTQADCVDLITLKQKDLKKKVEDLGLDCDKTKNAEMRKAIRDHFAAQGDLLLQEVAIESTKENVKDIWSKLTDYLPVYSLFVSDRTNNEGDKIVQDPLKFAVQRMFNDDVIKDLCHQIAERVINELQSVATGTLDKLNEMNPEVADQLKPSIGKEDDLKWSDIFKNVSIAGDDGIQVNKHGSGVRRLILLNFFRYEAEKKVAEGKDVVYAIEEPETSQHNEHIKMMMDALKALSGRDHIQIIITTHNPYLVKQMDYSQLRLVAENGGLKTVNPVDTASMPYISLNEVNYLAFGEASEEYHDELYGHLEYRGDLNAFLGTQPQQNYIRLRKDGTTLNEQKCKTEIIRHQIHHPENTLNPRYTSLELKQSIELMRQYLLVHP